MLQHVKTITLNCPDADLFYTKTSSYIIIFNQFKRVYAEGGERRT
jgi:hypothetical protein